MILIDDKLESLDLEEALPLLPPWRREQALRYVQDSSRRQSVAAWLLLRKACREVLQLREVPTVAWGYHGKPYFPDLPQVHFNLSHCRVAAACILEGHPVGIDIEEMMPPDPEVLPRVMNEREQREILLAPDPAFAFTRLWTCKESLLKLTGEGLTEHLDTLLEDRGEGIRFQTVRDVQGRYICTTASFSK